LLEGYERAAVHSEHAGLGNRLIGLRNMGRFHGSTPVTELLAWQDGLDASDLRDDWLRAYRAESLAMLGRFDEARPIIVELLAELAERGGFAHGLIKAEMAVELELLAGDWAAAVALGEEGC